ncbi:hypothetical protein BX600DRAFT_510100 [Xylariales sp. PMI_506]|nr:hypothetical protein BX600DRAFT_510100 [Xylariales sp. PMI_506]
MDEFPAANLPKLALPEGVDRDSIDAVQIVSQWLIKLEKFFQQNEFDRIPDLFIEDCWWRDLAGLNWDISTKHGHEPISQWLATARNYPTGFRLAQSPGLQPQLFDAGPLTWMQAGFHFRHPHGDGRGFVRLTSTGSSGEWKAWTMFSRLDQFDFQKELNEARNLSSAAAGATEIMTKPVVANGQGSHIDDQQPQVLIVGAGQSGLALGAQLKYMGISAQLVEQGAQLGAGWRNRYNSVRLHTPIYTDHYPFLKYPETWPRWLGRDSIVAWMEQYSQIMGLDVQLNTRVTKVEYDEAAKRYQVEVQSPQGTRVLSPRHLVLATGIMSTKPRAIDVPGQDLFGGEIYHSSARESASEISGLPDKKIVVLGAGSTAHDVAKDFIDHGATKVTMIQRSPIFSVSSESAEMVFSLFNKPGLSTEEADLIVSSLPTAVARRLDLGMTHRLCALYKDTIDGLERAGLAVKKGEDGTSLLDHVIVKRGRFYIDQGANRLIIDGHIKVRQCAEGLKEFHADGITLADGTNVEADVIVLATGFDPLSETVRDIVGSQLLEKIPNFGLLDHEQERSGFWRETGVPGFWYMTGNFMWSRQYSQVLALQIAAVEKGFNDTHYDTK